MALLRRLGPCRLALALVPLLGCAHRSPVESAGPGALRLRHRLTANCARCTVSVVGDFNGWDPEANPMRPEPDAGFSVVLRLAPGPHVYAFSEQFPDGGAQVVPPEDAPAYVDDDLGGRDGLIRIPDGP